MSDNDILNKVHKRMVDDILRQSDRKVNGKSESTIAVLDEQLRRKVAELYIALEESGNRKMAVEILSDHIAILIEMTQYFKDMKR